MPFVNFHAKSGCFGACNFDRNAFRLLSCKCVTLRGRLRGCASPRASQENIRPAAYNAYLGGASHCLSVCCPRARQCVSSCASDTADACSLPLVFPHRLRGSRGGRLPVASVAASASTDALFSGVPMGCGSGHRLRCKTQPAAFPIPTTARRSRWPLRAHGCLLLRTSVTLRGCLRGRASLQALQENARQAALITWRTIRLNAAISSW